MVDRDYKTKIEIMSKRAYEEVNSFIGKISFEHNRYKHGDIYFLDLTREGIVRTNSDKKTVELTDKVESWIFDSINQINCK